MTSQSGTARVVSPRTECGINEAEFGINEWVVDEQRQRWLRDPGSVDRTWREFFASPRVPAARSGPSAPAVAPRVDDGAQLKAVRVAALIHAFRVRGHLMAATDPLTPEPPAHAELDVAAFGLDEADRAEKVVVDGFAGRSLMTVGEVFDALREFYCRTAGFEYMHLQDSREREWIQRRVERPWRRPDPAGQLRILDRLGAAEAFETFLQTKYVGQKRYSLEGGESAVVLLDALLLRAMDSGLGEAVIGMAHRGRLNVLANVVGKSCAQIFGEFEDAEDPRPEQGSGDV
ncbi:hypothetical protein WN71_031115 [Streptomyces mangrovisoli]|uniref:oxoglutarate dehydrogenase (succinyl-transferring) n=1 Tax=Streptomyces mangrovisoli TaxID=1428628 RepID=A0A1J4NNI5_9ACTN|nr:hypothetical protein WN71_031115 [Streptomyces mangrovisoli]